MSTKHSPGKITLGMIKGKPITTSVPVIRYRASDDELEELYPSTDDEELFTPESEHPSPKFSPNKSAKIKFDDSDTIESGLNRRSASVDGNLSEGTPPSDPWKVLSEIRGKITKTLEEKLSEIKNDKKKEKHRSRENSSISDLEDLGDITPTDENPCEKQEKESSPKIRRRGHFAGFSHIKTGLKTKTSEEESVESGVEAAELAEEFSETDASKGFIEETSIKEDLESFDATKRQSNLREQPLSSRDRSFTDFNSKNYDPFSLRQILARLKKKLIYQLISIPLMLLCSYYLLPLPQYLIGMAAGIFVTITIQNIVQCITKALTTVPLDFESRGERKLALPVLEIPAAEEHAVSERFEGWLNELPYEYNHDNYHVARTTSVFFRLEGSVLRVTETRTRVPKRSVWDEPKHNPRFTRKRVYSLVDARLELLPQGLIKRRRWSKKYPICIIFGKDALVEVSTLKRSDDENSQQIEADNEKTIIEEEETDEDLSQSKDAKDISEGSNNGCDMTSKMFIFARTDRQKEDWYRRLEAAINLSNTQNKGVKDSSVSPNSPAVQSSPSDSKNASLLLASEMPPELNFNMYMRHYIEHHLTQPTESLPDVSSTHVVWMNALIARILFDIHKSPETISLIQDKIQRKLSNIKLPYFMEGLLISELAIGQGAPVIHKVSLPTIDNRGLWLDLDILYEGSITMTVETKMNLMKLTKTGPPSNTSELVIIDKQKPVRSPMFDSDVEDSPETSTEDDDTSNVPTAIATKESPPQQSSGRKLLHMVDKLAANKYFQHATELSYVRRAMEGVSNTEIRLKVSVSGIEGSLSVNIPPAPSDRLWYGFKPVPKINLTAKPALGERAVNIGYITKWIETKLLREFEKVVVLPNMDDLLIPLCPNYPNVS